MDSSMVVEFLDCPAYLDGRGARRCGLPAEVQERYTARFDRRAAGERPDPVPAWSLVQWPG